jgi:hypothetical protein
MIEKLKNFIKEKPALFGGIVGCILVGIYYLFFRGSSTSTASDYSYSDPGIYSTPASISSGDTSGTSESGEMLSVVGDMMTGFFQSNKELMEGLTEGQESLTHSMTTLTNALQDSRQPNVEQPNTIGIPDAYRVVDNNDYNNSTSSKMYSIPVSEITPVTGGGLAIGTIDQLKEFASGGSKNKGGNYSLDFRDSTPVKSSSSSSKKSSSSSNATPITKAALSGGGTVSGSSKAVAAALSGSSKNAGNVSYNFSGS